MAVAAERRTAVAQITDRLARLVENFRAYREKRARQKETYDELSALSNRELDDLGIHRSEIARIAREAVEGR